MRWPWRVLPDRHRASLAEAKRMEEHVEAQAPRVEQLARELEARRKANRFTEAVRAALGGR